MSKPRPRRRAYQRMLRMLRRQYIWLQQRMDQLERAHRHLLQQLGVLEQRVAALERNVPDVNPDRCPDADSPLAANQLWASTGGDDALHLAQAILATHDMRAARSLAWSYLIARRVQVVDQLTSSDFLHPPAA